MADAITNSASNLKTGARPGRIELRYVAGFTAAVLAGGVATLYPWLLLVLLGILVFVGLCWLALVSLRKARLEVWQVFTVVALSGYMLLNYGFEGLTIHLGGFPLIVSYGLVWAALLLAILTHTGDVREAIKEPTVLCMLAIFAFSAGHLLFELPTYGLWAIRDSSMVLDALFLFVGMIWARKANSSSFLIKWMLVLFVVNALYSFTMPWGERLWAWSPESGVFFKVPIFGNYNGIGDVLTEGAMFCICLSGFILKRPRWIMPLLILAQFLGIAISQVRRMYVATAVVFIILMLLGEGKKFARLLIVLPCAIGVIVLVTAVGGIEIPGRVGTISLDFFKDHIRSISDPEGTPGSSVDSRFVMADEAMEHFKAHPILGEGFGQALVSEVADSTNNAVTRMPHNSSLSYLARLGLVGFAMWILFHLCLIARFIGGLRQRRHCQDKQLSALLLWLFLYYVIFMIVSLVEAAFEYPSGAVPFYFLMGFALGVMRWQFPRQAGSSRGRFEPLPLSSAI